MVSSRLEMLLVMAVALLAAAGRRADALPVTVADTDAECVHELVPCEGDLVSAGFAVVGQDVFWRSDHPDIDFTITSPGGITVYTLNGQSSEKFELKAPMVGMHKFCFHNSDGAPETVSFYIHDGHNLVVEETWEEEYMTRMFYEWMAGYHRTYKEEDMKKRFQEWMAEYGRTYEDEEEQARRYELFKDCAKIVDKLNAFLNGATSKTNHFCDLSKEELGFYY